MTGTRWYRDPAAWRVIAFGYLPWLAGLSLAWEIAHLPLYTLWTEAAAGFIAFSVAHCTAGDILIGTAALVLALTLSRECGAGEWRWGRVAALATITGLGYTAFSEWMNAVLLQTWTYSELMPRLALGGVEIGLSPLGQWLFLPALALYFARRSRRSPEGGRL